MKFRLLSTACLCLTAAACSALQPKPKTEVVPVNRVTDARSVDTGDRLLEAGRHGQAVATYRSVLASDPANAEARYGLAEAMRQGGDAEASKAEYLKLADIPEWRSKALEGLGHANLVTGDHNGAFEALTEAVNEDIGAWRAWLGLAQLRDLAKDWDNADQAYGAALAVTDNPGLVLNNQGVSMLARGKPEEAVVLFKRALQADPKLDRAGTNLELASAASSGLSLEAMAAAEPDAKKRAQKLNNFGYVVMLQGRYDEAEKLFQAAIETHPSFYSVAFENMKVLRSLEAEGKKSN
jgi:Tfp pilus assembly protein PilF